jgi:hypothetical protein
MHRYPALRERLVGIEDSRSLWHNAGRGFALWNLRRDFVATDREREYVKYEDFQGHKLDRKMLEVVAAVFSAAGDPSSAFRNVSAGLQFASAGSRKEAQHQ